ncbi:MAG: TetR/AcrR family transcriptional regulator [Myxococcota bacterium]|nr:TetR/AcrR family transcriptional regulator [Myxococcota bacterium]
MQRLLTAARQVFVEKGFDGARVDKIATRAGVNKRMIYDWFGSKEQLYLQVLRDSFSELFRQDPPDPTGDIITDVKNHVRWYFWFLSNNPSFVRLLGWETLNDGRHEGKVVLEVVGAELTRLQETILDGKQKGIFRKDVHSSKVVLIFAELCLVYFSKIKLFEALWHQDLSSKEIQEQMLDHILKIVIDGLRIPTSQELPDLSSNAK